MVRYPREILFITLLALSHGQALGAGEFEQKLGTAEKEKKPRTDIYGDPLPPDAIARLGSTRLRHRAEVWSVLFSRDGNSLISSGPLGSDRRELELDGIRIWDPRTGKLLRRLGGFVYGPGHAVLSPDGKLLATESGAGVVCLLDLETGKMRYRLTWADKGNVLAISFSPDGKILALTGAGSRIQLWATETGEILKRFGPEGGWAISYSPDGNSIASTGKEAVHLWDPATGKEIWRFGLPPDNFFGAVQFSRDGKLLAVGGDKTGNVWLLEAGSGKEVRNWRAHETEVHAVAFSPDPAILATGSDAGEIRLWEISTGKQVRQLPGHKRITYSIAFSPDGRTLASGGHDSFVRLWDVASGKELLPPAGHQSFVCSVAFSPDGRWLACGDFEGTVRVWDPTTSQQTLAFGGSREPLSSVAYSPDGKMVASGGWDRVVRLYDQATRKERLLKGHHDRVYSVAFHPDGHLLASASIDSTIRLWSLPAGKEVGRMDGGAVCKWVTSLAFSLDGHTLASGREDGTVHLCEVATGKLLRTLAVNRDSVTAVSFRPDGRALAAAGYDGMVHVFDLASGREFVRYTGHRGIIGSVAFSPDGWFLVSGDAWGTLLLWEVVSGKEVLRMRGHDDSVQAVAYAPDGQSVASGSRDFTVLIWDSTGLRDQTNLPVRELSAKEVENLWDILAGNNAVAAYRAIWRLRSSPSQAVPFLGRQLTPVAPIPAEQLARLIAALDDGQPTVRDQASQELEELGELAVLALEKAQENTTSAEVRRRCEAVLQKVQRKPLTTARLRELRAIAVLEYIATPEARRVLEKLSTVTSGSRVAPEAAGCLQRIAKRQAAPP